jgi:hypothetical protein
MDAHSVDEDIHSGIPFKGNGEPGRFKLGIKLRLIGEGARYGLLGGKVFGSWLCTSKIDCISITNGLPSECYIDQWARTIQLYLSLPLFHYASSYEEMTIATRASGGPLMMMTQLLVHGRSRPLLISDDKV